MAHPIRLAAVRHKPAPGAGRWPILPLLAVSLAGLCAGFLDSATLNRQDSLLGGAVLLLECLFLARIFVAHVSGTEGDGWLPWVVLVGASPLWVHLLPALA